MIKTTEELNYSSFNQELNEVMYNIAKSSLSTSIFLERIKSYLNSQKYLFIVPYKSGKWHNWICTELIKNLPLEEYNSLIISLRKLVKRNSNKIWIYSNNNQWQKIK